MVGVFRIRRVKEEWLVRKNRSISIAVCVSMLLIAKTSVSYAEKPLSIQSQPYMGIFQQTISGKRMGDKIEFQNVGCNLYLNYERIEYFGEHGIAHYFYADSVELTKQGISFEIPVRTLYSAPLRSGKFLTIRGYSKHPIQFSGKLENGKLLLLCSSQDESACFDRQLIFQRIQ
jgi:hypothetical protein